MSAYSQFSSDPVHILYLNSYNARMTWVRDILRGVEDVLDPDHNNIVLHLENMETKVFHSEEHYWAFTDFIKQKYRNNQFSLILCSDNNAFDFLIAHHKELYPDVPVVFCGVNDFEDQMLSGHDEFTGIEEIFSAMNTVDLALQLHPETEEIYIINDYLKTGRAWQRVIESELKPLENRIKLTYSENLSMEELQAKIISLPAEAIILLGVYYSDKDGRFSTYEKTGEIISSVSEVPLYCLLEFNIRKGVLGGEVISGYSQGEEMARIGLRILEGESPGDIPVKKEGVNELIFNYPQLERFSIPVKTLPKHSIIINRPYSVYKEYRTQIWIAIAMFSILLIFVIALIINIIRKNQAEISLRQLAEATWEGIVIHDHGTILQFNNIFLTTFGYSRNEINRNFVIDKLFTPKSLQLVNEKIETENTEPYEVMGTRNDGSTFPIEIRVRIIDFKGKHVRVAAIRDLTKQKKMEARFSQSQKMQAIGTLAGGIAHDFNNILSAVIGYADLGLLSEEPESEAYSFFNQILSAGTRARELVKQILSFSRQSKKDKQTVNLSIIIRETTELLKASLPSTIQINQDLDTTVHVQGDPAQMQQVIMNICTNAGLAMKENGGILDIVLKKTFIEDTSFSEPEINSGMYAQLIISDTGCGMTEDVQKRVFEPFFTTRSQGEGTGLGLSVVHGIVTEMSGTIGIYAVEGQGTTFNIFLPLYLKEDIPESVSQDKTIERGRERILFVDDEILQVNMAKDILGFLGYNITATTDSNEALNIFSSSPDHFDLLITDVTMPNITGDVLVEKIHQIREGLPVLMCTGYSERISRDRLDALGVNNFVMKPLLLRELAAKVRMVLKS